MIKGLNHVGISVSSMDRSLGFYRDLLGMEVVVRTTFGGEKYNTILNLPDTHGAVALLRLGELQIELFEFSHPIPQPNAAERPVCNCGITHFCLQVTNIHEEYTRLAAAGVKFHCPPQQFGGGAVATYGRDPDGNAFELLETPSEKNAEPE